MNLRNIIRQAIDIHVHIGPEIIPRKYTAGSLAASESGKIGGFVLKNHFYPTSPFIEEVKNKNGLEIFGSIVLNNSVGGLNSQAIESASFFGTKPLMVWFPTINAENFLKQSKYEIAPEWVKTKGFRAQKAGNVQPVVVTRDGNLTNNSVAVLRAIKQCKAVLATGHISWSESVTLVNKALKMGIKKIVITHPIYQRIDMPVSVQKKLAMKGCFIEQSYSMYAIDKIPIEKIAGQIKYVGTDSVILSSDVGQTFSPPPSVALYRFAKLLKREGITENELFTMLVKNPKRLLGLNK